MPQAKESSTILLIIDSSSFIIERLVSILKDVKIIKKILTANNYDNALDVLQKTKTDVVLLDIQLPAKNGIDLLKHIVYHFPKIKVIVLSNLVSDYYQKLCKTEGACFFIDKSKDFDKIPEVILSVSN